jgi:hypothetical protein
MQPKTTFERIDTKRCHAILGIDPFDGSFERCDSPDHTTANHSEDLRLDDLKNQPAHLAGKHCIHGDRGCCLCGDLR